MDTAQLCQKTVYLFRAITGIAFTAMMGCATLPTPTHEVFTFPDKEAFLGKPERPFTVLGSVKSKLSFQTIDPEIDEKKLCRNYYNASVQKLVAYAKEKGADAVADVRSTVFYMDGSSRSFEKPECFDDGAEGQILTQGVAIKFIPDPPIRH